MLPRVVTPTRRWGSGRGLIVLLATLTIAATTSVETAASQPTVAATTKDAAAVVLATQYTATPAVAVLAASRILDVPLYDQAYKLSCEEASLRMALAYEGIRVTDAQVLALIGTDNSAARWTSTGLRWGDPYTTFVGSPYGSETALTGYGTYFPTIAAAARAFGGTVLAAGEGISPDTLYADVLAGHPVVAWVTYQWVGASRQDYVAFDGRLIPYAGPVEHAVTVVGVTATQVYVNNPDFGLEVISRTVFESSYATYNDMAVVLE